jgi:hypothetical protein
MFVCACTVCVCMLSVDVCVLSVRGCAYQCVSVCVRIHAVCNCWCVCAWCVCV